MDLMYTTITIYLLIGASIPVGQIITSEIGKYIIWPRKTKYKSAFAIGVLFLIISSFISFIFSIGLKMFPVVVMLMLILGKIGFYILNRSMGLELTEEEIMQRYGKDFNPDIDMIKGLLEDDFTQKLFSGEGPSLDIGEINLDNDFLETQELDFNPGNAEDK